MTGIRDPGFEIRGASSNLESRISTLVVCAAVFLAVRVVLLFAREPFFDELFTVWMARQPFARIVPNLLHDSGPPLYYGLARFDSVVALRWLSLLFAAAQFAIVVRRSVVAALLLALYPPAVLLSVDARAYALCALFVTAGVIALDRERPVTAALLFVLAAYSHYYGVFFFPLLLVRRKWVAFASALVLFAPGLVLALHQPAAALRWNREALFAPLANLSFAGLYPYALFLGPPLLVVMIALLVLAIAVSKPAPFAAAVLIPLVLVIAFHIAGRPVYFPMRFESVIAGPLVLWLAAALAQWPVRTRRALTALLALAGAFTVANGIVDHEKRPLDPFREAAIQLNGVNGPIVATGYLYLESIVALNRPVIAWPAEQAEHPGWRATSRPDARELPSSSFVWIGERIAPELPTLREARPLRPLFWNSRTLIARAGGLTPPVH